MTQNEMIKAQRYGVEIEFTGISRSMAAEIVAKELNSTSSSAHCDAYYTRYIMDQNGREWKIQRDSSITPDRKVGRECDDEYKVEFVTPPLNYSDIEKLQLIVRAFKAAGAKVNSSCGIHVHVDGANHTPMSLERLVNFMVARQDLIYDALEIGDRANHWCHKLNKELLVQMKKHKELTARQVEMIWYSKANDNYYGSIDHSHYNHTRYHGVNLHAFFSKGTVEFRLFNSTLHAGKIKAYIQFCLAVSAWAITSKDDKIVFRSMDNYTSAQRVTLMRNILVNRLGLCGEEFSTCRLHIMNPLKSLAGMHTREQAA